MHQPIPAACCSGGHTRTERVNVAVLYSKNQGMKGGCSSASPRVSGLAQMDPQGLSLVPMRVHRGTKQLAGMLGAATTFLAHQGPC